MNSNFWDRIVNKIEERGEISPFLFLWSNKNKLSFEIENIILKLFEKYSIDSSSLFRLQDDWANIKIKDLKEFLSKSNQKPRFKFQVFLIENISRFTLKSANSCLKFFEEPSEWNIVFLTNKSEAGILDTIISRVQIVNFSSDILSEKNDFFYCLIDSYIKTNDYKLISYFFTEKLEKTEYIIFLKTLIFYIKENFVFIDLLDDLEKDINLIQKNNLLAKYVVDKFLLSMRM